MRNEIQNSELGIKNCFTWNMRVFFVESELYVPFRPHVVILTHRRSRAVSEESVHCIGKP